MGLGLGLADPSCIHAVVKQKIFINRNSALFWVRPGGEEVQGQIYWGSGHAGSQWLLELTLNLRARLLTPLFLSPPQVTLSDKSFCFDQGISGHHLVKTSVTIKVWTKPGGEG